MSVIVKICGLSTPETLEAALAAGADMVGLVFFPASPRHVGSDTARALADIARGRAEIVALAVDPDDAMLERIVAAARPDLLQLHGRETPQRVRRIREMLGLPVMKALALETPADLDALPDYMDAADRILFDARAPKLATRPGGLGRAFDWRMLDGVTTTTPYLVSGGLHAGNVGDALRVTRAGGVDVSSGVERAAGIKDAALITDFIRAARATEDLMTQ